MKVNHLHWHSSSNVFKKACGLGLFACLTLGAMLLTFGCKKATSSDFYLTVKAEGDCYLRSLDPIKRQKGTTWKDVKAYVEYQVVVREGYVLDGWFIEEAKSAKDTGDAKRTPLEDKTAFLKDTTVVAVTRAIEKTEVALTIEGDERCQRISNNTIVVKKGSSWKNVKNDVTGKGLIGVADRRYEIKEWHKDSATGALLTDETTFSENATLFAVTGKKDENEIYITLKADANFTVKDPTKSTEDYVIKAKKGEVWNERIKAGADSRRTSLFTLKEGFEFKEWRKGKADGEPVKWEDKFESDIEIFAVAEAKKNVFYVTVEVDEGFEFKGEARSTQLKVESGLNSVGSMEVGLLAVRIAFGSVYQAKDGYEPAGLKFGNKNGAYLDTSSSFAFKKACTVYAVSNKKGTNREKVTLTLKGDGGVAAGPKTITFDKGAKWGDVKEYALMQADVQKGYDFVACHFGNKKEGKALEDGTVLEINQTVFAETKGQTVKYKVRHMQEDFAGEYAIVAEEEEKEGEVGKPAELKAKVYEGFGVGSLPSPSATISCNQTTGKPNPIDIQYARKDIRIRLDINGGKIDFGDDSIANNGKVVQYNRNGNYFYVGGKFGTKVPELPKPTIRGDEFAEWNPALPETFPADSTKSCAEWNNAVYRVTVKGDERTWIHKPDYVLVKKSDSKKLSQIKTEIAKKVVLKPAYNSDDWEVYDYVLYEDNGNSSYDPYFDGKKVDWEKNVEGNITLYARTNFKQFDWEGAVLKGAKSGKTPSGNIIIDTKAVSVSPEAFVNKTGINGVVFDGCEGLAYLEPKYNTDGTVGKKSPFAGCTGLRKLSFRGCKALKTLDMDDIGGSEWQVFRLDGCEKLEKINLTNVERLEKLEDSQALKTLIISGKIRNNNNGCELKIAKPELLEVFSNNGAGNLIGLNVTEEGEKFNFAAFTGLKSLYLRVASHVKNLNLSGLAKLEKVHIKGCGGIEKIDLSGCAALTSFKDEADDEGKVKEMNFAGCAKLKTLEIVRSSVDRPEHGEKNLEVLDISECVALESLGLQGLVKLEALELSKNTALKKLALSEMVKLEVPDLTKLANLEEFSLFNYEVFSGTTSSPGVAVPFNEITEIDLSKCTKLKKLELKNTKLEKVDASKCTDLESVVVNNERLCKAVCSEYNHLTFVDISGCEKITEIKANTFTGCVNAKVKLPKTITTIRGNAFGKTSDSTLCRKLLVPTDKKSAIETCLSTCSPSYTGQITVETY